MTPADIASAAEIYHKFLLSGGAQPVRMAKLDQFYTAVGETALRNHLAWMCEHILKLVIQNEVEKACRWLGFVQGCLYMSSDFTIDDLRTHNGARDIP